MRSNARGDNQSPQTDDASITIDARDVLAGHYDDVRLEAGR